MRFLAPLLSILGLHVVAWTPILGMCSFQKCQNCTEEFNCSCSGQKVSAPCVDSVVQYFHAHTGVMFCDDSSRIQKHKDCEKQREHFRFDELKVQKVEGHLNCSDLMKKGCVSLPEQRPHTVSCWCKSLKKFLGLERQGLHLAIFDKNTGELLCPSNPQTDGCTQSTEAAPLSPPASPPAVTESEAAAQPPTPAPPDPGHVALIVGAGVAVILIFLGALVALMVVRRRRQQESKAAPPQYEENELYGTLG